MAFDTYQRLLTELAGYNAALVAVSKTKPAEQVLQLYKQGQRVFGENTVQELTGKHEKLPKDIHWHLIGHLQTNKVKYIAPFVSMIHSVDSLKLLKEIDKQAEKNERVIDCLLQIHIAQEESKYGLSYAEAEQLLTSPEVQQLQHIRLCGFMGIATNTEDESLITREFEQLHKFFMRMRTKPNGSNITELSMGMSSDYKIALRYGATMIRVGSMLFGERDYKSEVG